MKKTVYAMGLGVLLVFWGCSATSVRFDYERGIDFSKFNTFDFYKVPTDVTADRLVLKRIDDAIVREMQAKGLTQTSDNPDLLIAVHTQTKDKINVSSWGYSYADYYYFGYWGMGPSQTTVTQYEEGSLIIDLVDNADDELIWRGVATRALPSNPTVDTIDKIIDEVVTKTLANYPPAR